MAKVSGSYKSLVKGVSQQVPESRLDGQHGEQVNLLSDPVRGLSRRQGSVLLRETAVHGDLSRLLDLEDFVNRDVTINGVEYALVHRRQQAESTAAAHIYAFEKATGNYLPLSSNDMGALGGMLNKGIAGITTVGQFLIVAGKEHVITKSGVEQWDTPSNSNLALAWVRGGAFSRTFTVTVTWSGVGAPAPSTWTYTPPASAYQGVLDTSDILTSDPDYQKKVNDRVNAHTSASTQWTGTATAAIQANAIAEQLRVLIAATASGSGGGFSVERTGSHLLLRGLSWGIAGITVSDGGDGTLLRALHQEVTDASLVTAMAVPGKVVLIRPRGSEGYYLKAIGSVGGNVLQEVRWEETGATTETPISPFAIGVFFNGQLRMSTTTSGLQTLLTGSGITVPSIAGRQSGDSVSQPSPNFIGKSITYLGTFQDRLVIGCGSVLNFSKIGDYFNFYRASALTQTDDDPVEVFSVGSEQDVIRHGTIFDKSLLLFGDKQQYSVSGRVPLTPSTANVMQSSAHADATAARPVASGDLVFYAKSLEGSTQLYQIAVGNVEDTSNSTEISQQLSTYIVGEPIEIVGLTKPDLLIVRTNGDPYTLYVFRYLDINGGQQRVLEAWSKWVYSPVLGKIIGLSVYKGSLRIITARGATAGTFIAFDEQSTLARDTVRPHLDSLRLNSYANGSTSPGWSQFAAAFPNDAQPWRLQGADNVTGIPGLLLDYPLADPNTLWLGAACPGFVELTSPFPRDRQTDAAITTGRTTITSLALTYAHTGGFSVEVDALGTTQTVMDFNGRIVNESTNLVGIQPIAKGTLLAFIGREVRDYTARIRTRSWLPLTLTVAEWIGQYFNNTQRR